MPLMTWATHVLQWTLTEGSKTAMWSKPLKMFSVQIAGQYVEKIGFISIENDELNLIFYGLYFDFIVVIFY